MHRLDSEEWGPPAEFDGFRVGGRLGRGGMGDVYLGRDIALHRDVALKFIAGVRPAAAERNRLLNEARAIARLQHPNVVGVYRVGDIDGRPYIAYEFVSGRGLDREPRPAPWQRVLEIGAGLARGLAAAHRRDVLHRDIKPANAMLAESGEVKLLDFGLAKLLDAPAGLREPSSRSSFPPSEAQTLNGNAVVVSAVEAAATLTATGQLMGTPLYMAPELWHGEAATARSDLYALGLVLYELLAGRLPFDGLLLDDLMVAVLTSDVPPIQGLCPNLPSAFAEVIDRCVRRAPKERYPSAEQVMVALDALRAVYQPFNSEAPPSADEDDALLIARSFSSISRRADAFATAVYERLFQRQPELRRLFPADLADQRKKLLGALQITVENLKNLQQLLPLLEDLGRRHASFGVKQQHFDALGEALFTTLGEFEGDAFSAGVERAWARAFASIADAMRRGLLDERPTPAALPFAAVAYERELVLDPPRTRYAGGDEASIAYQRLGAGPVDLVLYLGGVTQIEVGWQSPELARFLRGLAACSRLVIFDQRGTGLSDRAAGSDADARSDDLLAVLDAAGVSRAVLFGVAEGAALSALFAARHPERVRGLILYGGSPCTAQKDDYPQGLPRAAIDAALGAIESRWGEPLFLEQAAPSSANDDAFRRFWASYLRTGAAPRAAMALLRANAAIDVRGALAQVAAPTLVLHRERDAAVSVAGSHAFARAITGAELVLLEGDDHLPFVGDVGAVLHETRTFIAKLSAPEPETRENLLSLSRVRSLMQ